jgi:hypothetical protein
VKHAVCEGKLCATAAKVAAFFVLLAGSAQLKAPSSSGRPEDAGGAFKVRQVQRLGRALLQQVCRQAAAVRSRRLSRSRSAMHSKNHNTKILASRPGATSFAQPASLLCRDKCQGRPSPDQPLQPDSIWHRQKTALARPLVRLADAHSQPHGQPVQQAGRVHKAYKVHLLLLVVRKIWNSGATCHSGHLRQHSAAT